MILETPGISSREQDSSSLARDCEAWALAQRADVMDLKHALSSQDVGVCSWRKPLVFVVFKKKHSFGGSLEEQTHPSVT